MQLSADVYRPLKGQRIKLSSEDPYATTLVRNYLINTPSNTYATRLEGQHVQLDNPPKQSVTKTERLAKKERRQKNRERRQQHVLGTRKAIEVGVWKFDSGLAKWDIFWPVHQMWISYMSELMNLSPRPESIPISPTMPNALSLQSKLIKADFHGSIVTVKDCKNMSRVGCSGIVVHETSNTFKIVTREDKLKVLPKQGTIFTFSIPLYAPSPHSLPTDAKMEFELYGNQFRFRAGDRATRKFKPKESIEL